MSVSLSRYAALVKNLRGVVVFNPDDDVSELIEWLVKRFKYRNVGVPPALVEHLDSKLLSGRPFVQLSYPTEELASFTREIAAVEAAEPLVVEASVLASIYVSPLLALGRAAAGDLEKLAVDFVESKVLLDDRGWRLHLRIADYTVLDFYQWSSEHAEKLWNLQADLKVFAKERAERIARDKKRYWRLQRGKEEPWRFVLYIDLAQRAARKPELLEVVRRYSREVVSAALAIEAAVLITGKGMRPKEKGGG